MRSARHEELARIHQTNWAIPELNYGIQVKPWLTLRPGLQYVMTPSGETSIPNALVLDLSATINF